MTKPAYADLVNRWLRWYCRRERLEGVECANWKAVETVMDKLTDTERCGIVGVYSKRDTMADNVYLTAIEMDMPQDKLWALIGRVSKDIAIERGLV